MVSMSNYVTNAVHKFHHTTPKRAQYAPHQWTRPNYDATKKSQLPWILQRQSQRNESAGSNKLLKQSSTMPMLWNALCYQPSTH